jgi:hypothetical protein
MNISWSNAAQTALRKLPRADAEQVDGAVQRWASSGDGFVFPGSGGAFHLFTGGFVVTFYWDDQANGIWVDRIRRAEDVSGVLLDEDDDDGNDEPPSAA